MTQVLEPPLFILAPARSGSSVAAMMLGQHPELYGVPELRLFHHETVSALLAEVVPGLSPMARLSGLLRVLAELHDGGQTSMSVARARKWLKDRRRWTTISLFDHLRALVTPRAIVEKSPETVRTDEALGRLLYRLPNARLLHLVRHPWATVASMVDAWQGLPFWPVKPEHAHEYCAQVWLAQHGRILRLVGDRRSCRMFRVRAEDLTDSTSTALVQICAFADIDDSMEALARMRAPERSHFAAPGPANAPDGLDFKFLNQPRLRAIALPATLQPPPHWRLDSRTIGAVQVLARRLGYREDSTAIPPYWQRGLVVTPA
jgi:Sulfotransferase family